MVGPLYRQIADDLRGQIEARSLAPGERLETEAELMERYQASRNTVRDAIKLLTTRGLVETRPGQGTYVTEKIVPYITTLTGDPATGLGGGEGDIYVAAVRAEGRDPDATDPRVEIQRASPTIALALRVAEGSQVVIRHQQRFIDGMPWSLQTSYYPMDLVHKGAARLLEAVDIDEGTVSYLKVVCGTEQAGYRDSIAVRPPDETEIGFFKLPADGRIAVFEIFRVAFDRRGERFRLTVTVYPTDRNRFLINVGEVPWNAGDADRDQVL